MFRNNTTLITVAAALTLAGSAALAMDAGYDDDAWVAMKGEVASVDAGSFAMAHHGGAIMVTLPGADALPMLDAGDEAMVYGYVNAAGDAIEAASVWNASDDRSYASQQMQTSE